MLVEPLAVDLELATAGAKEHAGHTRFATTRTVVLNQFCHLHSAGRTCSRNPSRKFAWRSLTSPFLLSALGDRSQCFRLLRRVRMFVAAVNFQLAGHRPAQLGVRDHADDRLFHNLLRLALEA